jgi:hypothetical protein
MSKRESQILCGLLLSKYGEDALRSLGFQNFIEAFNVLGAALDAPPSTIKNYRDELDPYFPNERKGWHKRPLRKHCAEILKAYGQMSLANLSSIVKTLFDPAADLPSTPTKALEIEQLDQSAFAKRLVTGRAAEGFFRTNYRSHDELASGVLVDTTSFGCGFDFRVNFADKASFYAVEVKGIYESAGNILLTEKEHDRAVQLQDRFFLYVVRGFRETPFASLWRDPLNSTLEWQSLSTTQTVNSWRTFL